MKYCIYFEFHGQYLRDLANLLRGQNDGMTNDNSTIGDVITYDSREEAQAVIDENGLIAGEVIIAPESLNIVEDEA